MSSDLRYGVIGTGMMGCEHIRNLNAQPGAQVVASIQVADGTRLYNFRLRPDAIVVLDGTSAAVDLTSFRRLRAVAGSGNASL